MILIIKNDQLTILLYRKAKECLFRIFCSENKIERQDKASKRLTQFPDKSWLNTILTKVESDTSLDTEIVNWLKSQK